MDFALAFKFPFKDPNWLQKIVLFAVITIIPIIGMFVLLGWSVEITRQVIRKELTTLPDLDFGKQLADGFKFFVVGLVYAIPIIILYVPFVVLASVMDSGSASQSSNALFGLISVCFGLLVMVYGLAVGVLIPAAIGNMADHGTIGDGVYFIRAYQLVKAAPGAYLIVLAGSFVAALAGALGFFLCFIGAFITLPYFYLVSGHLYGQAYNQANENLNLAADLRVMP